MKKQDLVKCVNDSSRHVTLRGKEAIVPEKFDKFGNLVDENTPSKNYVLHKCRLPDLKFLSLWRDADYLEDPEQMAIKASVPIARAKLLIKRLSWMKREEERIKILADIITPQRILVTQWDNVHTNELEDGQRDSLKEAAKIVGAYKNTAQVNIQNNFFAKPQMTPEQEEATRKFFDTIAVEEHHAA